ncbi:hypothetical protein G3W01_11045 [Escherichia coli]|nr:hypothetical protein [Escherichia coli]
MSNSDIDLMTMRDICDLLQRTRRGVYKVMARYQDFPQPLERRAHGVRMFWDKAKLMAWFEQHKQDLEKDMLRYQKTGDKRK